MDVFGVEKEYNWMVNILKSSKTLGHIDICDKINYFFTKKWDGILNEDQKNTFYYDFIGIRENILKKIEKNDVII
jgi:hypothetical protein